MALNYVEVSCLSIEFFLNVFHWIQGLKIYDINRTRTCHPATSCVRDQHDTTAPARHMWETGSLNQAQFMLHWSSVSLNSLNSAKVLLHLGKTPLSCLFAVWLFAQWNQTSQMRSIDRVYWQIFIFILTPYMLGTVVVLMPAKISLSHHLKKPLPPL